MRILRSYTIETDFVERMKNEGVNASELLNSLLTSYFKDKDMEDFTEEELKLQMEKLDMEDAHLKQIKEWEKKWEKRKK